MIMQKLKQQKVPIDGLLQCIVSDMTAFYIKGIYYELALYMDLWNNEIARHCLFPSVLKISYIIVPSYRILKSPKNIHLPFPSPDDRFLHYHHFFSTSPCSLPRCNGSLLTVYLCINLINF